MLRQYFHQFQRLGAREKKETAYPLASANSNIGPSARDSFPHVRVNDQECSFSSATPSQAHGVGRGSENKRKSMSAKETRYKSVVVFILGRASGQDN